MEPLFVRNSITLVITLFFGIYFSYTDITHRKIPNVPLLVFFAFGIATNTLTVLNQPVALKGILFAFALVLSLGLSTYYLNLWHPGDGKLFIAATVNFLPFTIQLLHPLSIVVLNVLLPFSICYCLMFLYLLIHLAGQRRFFKEIIRISLITTGERTLSLEYFIQMIMISALALFLPVHVNVILRTIILFVILRLIFRPFRERIRLCFKDKIKFWHLYGVISIGLFIIIEITNTGFSLLSLLSLFGFVCFFNFYQTLEVFFHLVPVVAANLTPGMELGLNLYKSRDKILKGLNTPKDTEVLFRESIRLSDTDIGLLKEIAEEQPDFYIPIREPAKSLPFAPFVIASTLFIMVKLLLKI